jgi:hypothetical protein
MFLESYVNALAIVASIGTRKRELTQPPSKNVTGSGNLLELFWQPYFSKEFSFS